MQRSIARLLPSVSANCGCSLRHVTVVLSEILTPTGMQDGVTHAVAASAAPPVHIVVVPGIFGEFIPRTPFEELLSADSAAKIAFSSGVKRSVRSASVDWSAGPASWTLHAGGVGR